MVILSNEQQGKCYEMLQPQPISAEDACGVGGEKGGDCRCRVSPAAVAPFEGDGGRLAVCRLAYKLENNNN